VATQDYEEKYTDAELSEEIKEEIKASDTKPFFSRSTTSARRPSRR
jgi:hypothetical protein